MSITFPPEMLPSSDDADVFVQNEDGSMRKVFPLSTHEAKAREIATRAWQHMPLDDFVLLVSSITEALSSADLSGYERGKEEAAKECSVKEADCCGNYLSDGPLQECCGKSIPRQRDAQEIEQAILALPLPPKGK